MTISDIFQRDRSARAHTWCEIHWEKSDNKITKHAQICAFTFCRRWFSRCNSYVWFNKIPNWFAFDSLKAMFYFFALECVLQFRFWNKPHRINKKTCMKHASFPGGAIFDSFLLICRSRWRKCDAIRRHVFRMKWLFHKGHSQIHKILNTNWIRRIHWFQLYLPHCSKLLDGSPFQRILQSLKSHTKIKE